ncbi:MAG: hypothetical protein JXD23_17765 [Spirochaetales bacterium]|nr:hypothetical protein [Spirochaetales bacterium]
MKQVTAAGLRAALTILVLAAAFGCASYPAEYVPPDKVVFLRQPYYLTPVRYPAASADPYAWDVDPVIDKVNPSILKALDFSAFLKPDLALDAGTYKETKGHLLLMENVVVIWPPSLPRYEGEEGDRCFWGTELYQILVHELVHLAVGEVTGVFSPVPVWLNEGLAVYTESRSSPEVKKYWDVAFAVCWARGALLDWDTAAQRSPSEFPADLARTDYAQSYKMVEYLFGRFGMKRVVAYVVSFKLPYEKIQDADLKTSYKENFRKTFQVTWEDCLKGFDEYCRKSNR